MNKLLGFLHHLLLWSVVRCARYHKRFGWRDERVTFGPRKHRVRYHVMCYEAPYAKTTTGTGDGTRLRMFHAGKC